MSRSHKRAALLSGFALVSAILWGCSRNSEGGDSPAPSDRANIYLTGSARSFSPATAGALPRVYVPNLGSDDVSVIDPYSQQLVATFRVGRGPQHIVPSWDLKTLWVTGSAEGKVEGSLTPINPRTGEPGPIQRVEDAYNMYFTPGGQSALVVAESRKRLDYRDPQTMKLQGSLSVPQCPGINHADFERTGSYAIFTCEFGGSLAKIDVVNRRVLGYLKLAKGGMPQDVRVGPDGGRFSSPT